MSRFYDCCCGQNYQNSFMYQNMQPMFMRPRRPMFGFGNYMDAGLFGPRPIFGGLFRSPLAKLALGCGLLFLLGKASGKSKEVDNNKTTEFDNSKLPNAKPSDLFENEDAQGLKLENKQAKPEQNVSANANKKDNHEKTSLTKEEKTAWQDYIKIHYPASSLDKRTINKMEKDLKKQGLSELTFGGKKINTELFIDLLRQELKDSKTEQKPEITAVVQPEVNAEAKKTSPTPPKVDAEAKKTSPTPPTYAFTDKNGVTYTCENPRDMEDLENIANFDTITVEYNDASKTVEVHRNTDGTPGADEKSIAKTINGERTIQDFVFDRAKNDWVEKTEVTDLKATEPNVPVWYEKDKSTSILEKTTYNSVNDLKKEYIKDSQITSEGINKIVADLESKGITEVTINGQTYSTKLLPGLIKKESVK